MEIQNRREYVKKILENKFQLYDLHFFYTNVYWICLFS